MQYLHPIKTQEQFNEIYNFVVNDLNKGKNWELFFNSEITKYLDINEEMFDETQFFQDVRKVLIQKLVVKTIHKNFKNYYENEEKIQAKQDKIAILKITLLYIYLFFIIVGIVLYSALTIKKEIYIMRKILKSDEF